MDHARIKVRYGTLRLHIKWFFSDSWDRVCVELYFKQDTFLGKDYLFFFSVGMEMKFRIQKYCQVSKTAITVYRELTKLMFVDEHGSVSWEISMVSLMLSFTYLAVHHPRVRSVADCGRLQFVEI
jgi:hypothetical protein